MITQGINEYLWHQEELGNLDFTNGLFTLLTIVNRDIPAGVSADALACR